MGKEENNHTEVKKEKPHSNKKTVIRLLLCVVGVCMAVMIFTGAWIPFKSHETTKEAQEAVTESVKLGNKISTNLKKINKDALDDEEYPGGFEIFDYSKENNKDGILKLMRMADYTFDLEYGATLYMYYFKNEDYVQEYYISLKNSYLSNGHDEYDIDGGKVSVISTGEEYYLIVEKGTVIYFGLSQDMNLKRIQKWFDVLDVDFQVEKEVNS